MIVPGTECPNQPLPNTLVVCPAAPFSLIAHPASISHSATFMWLSLRKEEGSFQSLFDSPVPAVSFFHFRVYSDGAHPLATFFASPVKGPMRSVKELFF